MRHAISGLKHTEQFDIRSFLTSILHPCLSKSLQVEWEVHSNKIKGVPPVEDFLDFVMFRATVLSTQPPVLPIKVPDHKPEKRQERMSERKPEQYQRHRAAMHVATLLGHLLPPKQLSFNLLRILCLFLSRRDAAAPQPEEQPAISHSH